MSRRRTQTRYYTASWKPALSHRRVLTISIKGLDRCFPLQTGPGHRHCQRMQLAAGAGLWHVVGSVSPPERCEWGSPLGPSQRWAGVVGRGTQGGSLYHSASLLLEGFQSTATCLAPQLTIYLVVGPAHGRLLPGSSACVGMETVCSDMIVLINPLGTVT